MSYYVTNENSVLNINNAHLKVSGNIQTDVMKLGAIEFAPATYPPESDVPGTVNFTNVTTGVTTSSNLNVGGTLMLGTVEVVATTHTLENTTALGNVTSNTIQFTNTTTSLVASGNVEVGGVLTATGNVEVSGNVVAGYLYGDGSNISGIFSNLDQIVNNGNVTSNTVQFTNATTSLVASGNVEVSGNLAIGSSDLTKKLTVGGPMRITDGLSNVCDLSIIATAATVGYSQEAKLLPVTSAAQAASGQFGYGVEISADGTYLVVGSPYSTNSAGLANGGCIHVFKKSGSTWTNVGGALEAPSNKYSTGHGVSISDDGLRVCAGCEGSQSAYVWDYSGGTWTRTTLATSQGTQYGWAISMSGDGKKIVVGEPGYSGYSGAIKSYTTSTSPGTAASWASANQINNHAGGTARYGSAVKISKDGNTLAVGAYQGNKVYTYKWNSSSWGAYGYDTFSGSNSFGWSMDINSDGTVLVVGTSDFYGSGTAYIYEGDGTYGGWGSGTAISPNPAANMFGRACAINGDGTSVIVGGSGNWGAYAPAGGVVHFKKESGSWVQKEIFTASDATSTGNFGMASNRVDIMAIASDGTLAVGHPTNSPAGAVYVFNPPNAGSTNLISSLPIKADGTILSFTGQHICVPSEPMTQGLVVSANKNKYFNLNGVLTTGVGAIRSSESIPMVSLSNVANDRSVFGVVDGIESGISTIRKNVVGPIMVTSEKEMGDNRVIVNSIGEGAIQVVDTNGPLVSGDYMTTSNITGYAQKQDSEFLANYTVAKITMDCDFNPVDVPIQVIKKKDNGENDLDKNGFIQWEDHPTRTQKAYNIGYLAADGTHIIPDTDGTYDEANVVYRTAYVGCTYHCG